MLDYKKMLQLKVQGASINSIANTMCCKWETVNRTVTRCQQLFGSLEEAKDLSNEEIASTIFIRQKKIDTSYLQPDSEIVLQKQAKGELRNDLWLAYVQQAKAEGKKSYKLSRFNEIISSYENKNDHTIWLTKQPGLEGQVDWVGDKAHIWDIDTNQKVELHIFVLSLPYSGYFYAEAFFNEKMEAWLAGHKRAFEFFGGLPATLIVDNCRTAVTRARGFKNSEAIINAQYAEFASHYGFLIKPARAYRPKDKAHVERVVQIVERDLLKPLSHHKFYSLVEYNRMLKRKLVERLTKPYSKRIGSRVQIFEQEELKTLLPLPTLEFESFVEKKAVVGRDTHIQFDCAYYSVPVKHIKETVIVRATETQLLIFNEKRTLIAQHNRAIRKWQRCTHEEHLPKGSNSYLAYSRSEFINRAQSYGDDLVQWCNNVLDRFEFEVQGYRTLATVLAQVTRFHPTVVKEAAIVANSCAAFSSKGFLLIAKDLQSKWEESRSVQKIDVNSLFCSHKEN